MIQSQIQFTSSTAIIGMAIHIYIQNICLIKQHIAPLVNYIKKHKKKRNAVLNLDTSM